MKNALDFIIEHWISVSGLLLLIVTRLIPTEKNQDIAKRVLEILDLVIPNLKKGGGRHKIKNFIIVFVCLFAFENSYGQLNTNTRLVKFNAVQSPGSDTTSAVSTFGRMWYDQTSNKFRGMSDEGTKFTFNTSSASASGFNQNDISEISDYWNTGIFSLINSGIGGIWYDGIGIVNKNDTLYQLGGWNSVSALSNNYVFRSVNGGVTWDSIGSANWAARHTFGTALINGYAYIVGGDYLNNSTQKREVWRTRTPNNITSWELLTNTAGFGSRILYGFAVLNNVMYIAGGQISTTFADGTFNDVWKSTDGITWTQVSSGHTFMQKNISGCMVAFNNRLYIVSGGRYDTNPINKTYDQTVYSSADGITWRQESNIPVAGVQYPNLVVWDGKLWLMNGAGTVSNQSTISYLDKSGIWHTSINYSINASFVTTTVPSNHAAGMVVYKNSVLRINGNNTNSVYKLSFNKYVTNTDSDLTFLTPTSIQINKSPSLSLQTESGTELIYADNFDVHTRKRTTVNGILIVRNNSGQINFQNTSTGLNDGYFEYASGSFDLYYNNSRYWRWFSHAGQWLAGNSGAVTGIAGGGILWANTADSFKPYWTTASGSVYDLTATSNPAGLNTQVQYNNSGAFGAESDFNYDATTNTLSVPNATVTTKINPSYITNNQIPFKDATGLIGDADFTFSSDALNIGTTLAGNPLQLSVNGISGTGVSNSISYTGNAGATGTSISITAGASTGAGGGGIIQITPGNNLGAGSEGYIEMIDPDATTILRTSVTGGISNTAGNGLKHLRTTTGSIAAGASALVTINWGTNFTDANYTCSCSIQDATAATASLQIVHIETVSLSQVVVRIENTSAGSLTGTLHCIGIHD